MTSAMILLHYLAENGPRLAVRTADGIFDGGGARLEDVLAGATPTPAGAPLDGDGLTLAPSVPEPGKIVCVGLNYRRHAAETGMPEPEKPVLFSKFGNALAGCGAEVELPAVATQYDYEAELVVVMGRRAKGVSEADALDHVWGYTNGNDLSARDLQFQSTQWLLGKTLDGFGPMGPWLVSRDEVGDLAGQPIRCWVNGDLRQDSVLGDMIFGVPELVSFISRHMTLEPGDVIFTGTPHGVAQGRPDKPWLVPGDEVVVEVGPLGRLVNRLVAPR
jgi:2-keto-4-pentenoate hydratase/2-oxohepta-3-ene-1,7-dioic acid hydratase in catechol pathway